MARGLFPWFHVWQNRLGVGACFFAALAGTAGLITARLPFPAVPDLAQRFHYFAARKDEFDTIFIGSSRIQFQVIPQQFDAEAAAHGVAVHSFNLGYAGMWPPESYYYLRQVLALHPRHLRWVLIELMDYRFGEVEHKPPTMRTVYWHDWKHTAMALRLVLESPLPGFEKMQLLVTHGWLLWQRMTNPGRGAAWLEDHYAPSSKKSDLGWTMRAGFDPEAPSKWTEAARAEFARQVAALGESLPPQRVRPGLAAALGEIIRDVQQAGAKPIFIIPPTMRVEENLAFDLPPGLAVWAFNQPAEYPQLYLPETHSDQAHLNLEGAREWTSLLAGRLAEAARGR